MAKARWIALSVCIAATTPSVAVAGGNSNGQQTQESLELQRALQQMATAEVQRLKTMNGDRDQGDENASDRAKDVVCSKGNPASQRSAICDVTPN